MEVDRWLICGVKSQRKMLTDYLTSCSFLNFFIRPTILHSNTYTISLWSGIISLVFCQVRQRNVFSPGRFFSMANSFAKYHWQLLRVPADDGPPRQLSHNPQSQSVVEQSQTSTLYKLFLSAGTLTLSQFGVAKDTIVPTVVIKTQIIAVITKQFTILTIIVGLPSQKMQCYQNFRLKIFFAEITSGLEFHQISRRLTSNWKRNSYNVLFKPFKNNY